MVLPQVIALFHALFNVIGLPGNLVVIVVIVFERRFHVMRYFLLASLAVSDMLCLILVNSFRIASIAKERWLYGQTTCLLNSFFARYFFLKVTVDLQGCLPKNHSYARRLCYSHRKVYITVKLIKCKIRRNKHF